MVLKEGIIIKIRKMKKKTTKLKKKFMPKMVIVKDEKIIIRLKKKKKIESRSNLVRNDKLGVFLL